MGEFGPYDRAEQLDLAGYAWTAGKESGPPQFVVRFREPPAIGVLAAARLQKEVADAKAPGWAPIYQVGSTPKGGAYYVTDVYPWSAQLLFEQKDRVTSPQLLKLSEELAVAMEGIHSIAGVGHANLKLSNILLTSRDLDRAKVFVCDPAPPRFGGGDAAADQVADRRALGRFIFELVSGTAFRDYFWPVHTQEKWDALGPHGAKWLDLCNRLLAPAGHETACTIEQFRKEVAEVRPAPTMGQRLAALPWKRIAAAAAVLLVLSIAAAIGWRMYRQAKLNAAIALAHQTVHQSLEDFNSRVNDVEQMFTDEPALQAGLKREDLLASAGLVDTKLDLGDVKQIEQVPARTDAAVGRIKTIAQNWRDAAMDVLSAQHFNNQAIDEATPPRLDELKASTNTNGSLREAAQLVAGMLQLSQALPGINDPKFRAARPFGQSAMEKIIKNPALAAQAIAGFKSDLQKATAGDPAYIAIAEGGDAIEAERDHSRGLFADLKALAPPGQPNLYNDLRTAMVAPSASPPDNPTVETAKTWKEDSIRQLQQARQASIALAQAKADKVTFAPIAPINAGFSAFVAALKTTDSEAALRTTARVIFGLDKLRAAWPARTPLAPSPGFAADDVRRIAAAYLDHLAQAEQLSVQSIVKEPLKSAAAIATLRQTNTQLRAAAVVVASQFQRVAKARTMLADDRYPASPATWKSQWEEIKADVADAAVPVPGWPDPMAADSQSKINDVLSALDSQDVARLQQYADSAATPALLNAVCVKWPAVHADDPNVDVQIFQSLVKSLRQLPAPCGQRLSDLWSDRLGQSPDAARTEFLWGLAQTMGLDRQYSDPPRQYVNDWIGYLKARYPAKKKTAIKEFITKTDLFDKWGLTATQSAAVSDFRDRLQSRPVPGTGKLPGPAFTRLPDKDVLYTPPFDPSFVMHFKLIVNKAGGSFYMCTTDAPVGWFIDLVDPSRAPIFKHLMDLIRPQNLVGPCAWARDGEWMKVNPPWIAPTVFATWSAQLNVVPASALTPMQYVSPLAAMDAARLVGCRLPTVDEWRQAYGNAARDHDDNTDGPNWQALRSTISAIVPDPGPATLSFKKFVAEMPLQAPTGQPANVNDQVWLREVPRDFPTLHDMRGNVSQWVLSSPAPTLISDNPIIVRDEAGDHQVNNQDDAQLNSFYTHAMRIGLSVVSSSNEDESTPRVPDDPRHNHHHQYFDVGFRLAIDDTPADPEKFLADTVKNQEPLAP